VTSVYLKVVLALTCDQFTPRSVLWNSPPVADATMMFAEFEGSTAMATARPPFGILTCICCGSSHPTASGGEGGLMQEPII
jgi:hypothetical protein